MKRVMLLVTVALLLAAAMALSGVAQAKPITTTKADKECLVEAVRTLQPGFNPSDYNFVGGTAEGEVLDGRRTPGPDVFCGFGGNDELIMLAADDIFLGGEGNDRVVINRGTFYGGEGDDTVLDNRGTFYGGEGLDSVVDGTEPVDGP
jgi:Ca2+-binding RTX toxin-like protein